MAPLKDDTSSTATPRLRFPEFREAGWISKRLEEVSPLQRGFDLPSCQLEPGNIPVVYSNGVQSFHSTAMAKGPGLVTGRSGTIGKLHFIESGDYWPHNTSLWVTSFGGNIPKFVYYLLDSIGIGRFASGSGVPTLNRNDVHAFVSAVPSSPAEQQKIADCLTSLDEVIAAQGRKVAALADHKRGLMQQLFPREGETLPRLRFPEFRKGPQWQNEALSENFDVIDGDRGINYPKTEEFSLDGFCVFLSAKNVTKRGFRFDEVQFISDEKDRALRKGKLQRLDLVLTTRGTIGQLAFYSDGRNPPPAMRRSFVFVAPVTGTDTACGVLLGCGSSERRPSRR